GHNRDLDVRSRTETGRACGRMPMSAFSQDRDIAMQLGRSLPLHIRYVAFQLAEVGVPRNLFQKADLSASPEFGLFYGVE
ncbi:MAG: hypothetical protein MK294_09065, partial [Rhodospirillales bacterium]|nr:hypothetical protein [Rhodospirillales bacterium]